MNSLSKYFAFLFIFPVVFTLQGCKQDLNIDFSASPSEIERGEQSNLVWKVEALAENTLMGVSIDPLGVVSTSGGRVVTPASTQDYVLTARFVDKNQEQREIQKKVTVSVLDELSWRWNDPSGYKDFHGFTILPPWFAGENFGINVTNYHHPRQDGWELVSKRMECSDYQISCNLPSQSTDTRYFPHFALYNRYTGILRLFIYINNPNFTGSKELIVTTQVKDNGYSSSYGLSLNESGISADLTNKTVDQNIQTSILPRYSNKWAVIDRHLSFDPSTQPNNIHLDVYLDEKYEAEIELEGSFNFTIGQAQKQGISSAIKRGQKTLKQVTSGANVAGQFLIEHSQQLQGMGAPQGYTDRLDSVGNFLANTALSLGSLAGPVDVIASVSKMFFGGGSVSSVQTGEGTITLSGTLISTNPQNFISVPFKNSTVYGLYSLKRPPEVRVSARCSLFGPQSHYNAKCPSVGENFELTYSFEGGIDQLIVVNPSAEMRLKEVKIQPHIVNINIGRCVMIANIDQHCNHWWIPDHQQNDFKWLAVPMDTSKNLAKTPPYELSATRFLPSQDSLTIIRNGRLHDYTTHQEPLVYYKVFTRFEHESKPNVVVEEIRTFKAKVIL